jgi:hypothetical protein
MENAGEDERKEDQKRFFPGTSETRLFPMKRVKKGKRK